MVDGDERVVATLGPVAIDAKISAVLAIAGVLATIRLVLQVGLAYLPARMASDTQAELREELFGAYSRASWDVQAEERDGHLQELLTNQIPQATQASLLATQLASAGLTFLTLVLAAFLLGPIVAVLVLVVAVLLAATLRPLAKHGRRHATLLSRAQVSYASSLGTSVRLAEETYTFGVAAAERERLGREADAARHHYLWSQFSGRLTQGLYQGLVILLLVGGLAGLLAADTGRIASLGGVVLILVRASSYGQQAQVAWHSIQQAAPYLDRLSEAKEQYLANPSTSGDRPFPASAALRFASVSFAYRPDRPVLRAIDLEAAPGEVLGIVGPSGAGKSTLVQLLMRMRSPTDGTIELGGVPIDEISLDEWRRHVAYVPQEPRLLHATVADNIRFARDLDDDRHRAKRAAGAHPRRHRRHARRLRHRRGPASRRRVGRAAPAPVRRPRTGGSARHPRARRADQRARPCIGGGDPSLPPRPARLAHDVHRHAPPVPARDLPPCHPDRRGRGPHGPGPGRVQHPTRELTDARGSSAPARACGAG